MDDASVLIILLICAVVGLVIFFAMRGHKPKTPSVPIVTTTMKPTSGKTTDSGPVVRYPQNTPQPDPVIPIFEDRTIRQVRRCPSCDGENSIYAKGCEICGRRL